MFPAVFRGSSCCARAWRVCRRCAVRRPQLCSTVLDAIGSNPPRACRPRLPRARPWPRLRRIPRGEGCFGLCSMNELACMLWLPWSGIAPMLGDAPPADRATIPSSPPGSRRSGAWRPAAAAAGRVSVPAACLSAAWRQAGALIFGEPRWLRLQSSLGQISSHHRPAVGRSRPGIIKHQRQPQPPRTATGAASQQAGLGPGRLPCRLA